MKTLFRTTLMTVAITSMISCKNESKSADETADTTEAVAVATDGLSFNDDKVGKQFQHYIHLKTALVNSDVEEAQSGAEMLMENTDDAALKESLTTIAQSGDIDEQRKHFADVTAKITAVVDGAISNGEVYKQYCPMAFNGEGGYWLSKEEEIRNPYFGDKMLKCGTVAETIK